MTRIEILYLSDYIYPEKCLCSFMFMKFYILKQFIRTAKSAFLEGNMYDIIADNR